TQREGDADDVARADADRFLGNEARWIGGSDTVCPERDLFELEVTGCIGHMLIDGAAFARAELYLRSRDGSVSFTDDRSFHDSQIRGAGRERKRHDHHRERTTIAKHVLPSGKRIEKAPAGPWSGGDCWRRQSVSYSGGES